jgi:hypothetical protein
MRESYLEGFVEALFPWSRSGSGKRSLGVWTFCTRCKGKGYLKQSTNIWRPCPDCYAGHSFDEEERAERVPDAKEKRPEGTRAR